MEFQLDALDTRTVGNVGAALHLKDLNGAPLFVQGSPVELILLGSDSDAFVEITRRHANERLATQKPGEIDWSITDRQQLEQLVECTVNWRGIWDNARNDWATFSKDACRRLYQQYPVVRDQAEAFIVNRANFLKLPAKLSLPSLGGTST